MERSLNASKKSSPKNMSHDEESDSDFFENTASDKNMHKPLKRRGIHDNKDTTSKKCSEDLKHSEESKTKTGIDSKNEKSANKKIKKLYPDLSDMKHEPFKLSKEPSPSLNHQLYKCLFIFMSVFAFMIACIFMFPNFFEFMQFWQVNKSEFNLTHSLNKLQTDYPHQLNLSWSVLLISVDKHLKSRNPKSPSILVLVSLKNAKCLTSCIARDLMSSVASFYHDSNINVINGAELDHNYLKVMEEVTEKFTEVFITKKRHGIIFENLENLPAASTSVLHGICDHENSPYKQGVIIMTVSSETSLSSESLKGFDEMATKKLELAWKEIGRDKLNALLSRLLVSVAVIRPGHMPQHCSCG